MGSITQRNLVYDKDRKDCLVTYRVDSVGNIHGTYTVHSLDGHLLEKRTYKHGLLDGVMETYCVSGGKRTSRCTYVADKLQGDYKRWSPHGHLLAHERYVNGKRHGLQEIFYLTGKICQRYIMNHGRYHGKYELYDAFEHLETVYNYDNGVYVSSEKI
jgi:antitoxin component YwqK of YwqJK toxin-antitoxin module